MNADDPGLGNRLNRVCYQALNATFAQGELAPLSHSAFENAASVITDGDEDEIELNYPIGYKPTKEPMLGSQTINTVSYPGSKAPRAGAGTRSERGPPLRHLKNRGSGLMFLACQDSTERSTMPIYEYRCEDCGHELEVLQKFSDAPLTDCPKCGESGLRKQISLCGFRLKGTGWYETDFKEHGKDPGKNNGASGHASHKHKDGASPESGSKSGSKGSESSGASKESKSSNDKSRSSGSERSESTSSASAN